MGERLRLVAEQQRDIAGFGLLFQQAQTQAGAVNRVGILAPLQRVPGPPPGEAPSHGVFEVKACYFSIALSLCCLDPEREPVFAMRSR
jgi:hypothetical protein